MSADGMTGATLFFVPQKIAGQIDGKILYSIQGDF
jgi:hypothetical protein